ncbi:tether containing UBX domain for GLUT4 isoform X2 [Palaemon carinicauda]|uniref:tether containing UBX domain for GLUT4 isoform X2 n=1 Tax=Palaemon carinicauda TaxID=392227 RepID=UPI0035B64B55
MAMSVTVLCPNGRRVSVKVTPNTSILQIIEDACKKEKFDSDQYDLKHLHRTLDSSSTVRYTNLPNKCQLELVKCAIPRKSSLVTVNVASDAGMRLVHDFTPETTLWEILNHHEQQGHKGVFLPPEDDLREAVIVYMMRRVSGPDLKTTTLKSLGLTSGKCMLRHSFQILGDVQQAHVSAPLSRPKPPKAEANVSEVPKKVAKNVPQEPQLPQPSVSSQEAEKPAKEPVRTVESSSASARDTASSASARDTASSFTRDPASLGVPHVLSSAKKSCSDAQSQNGVLQSDQAQSSPPMPMEVEEGCASTSSETFEVKENVIKLGARDAFLFNIEDAPPTNITVDDESFFDLTVNEVKGLYREQQQMLRSLEEAPLLTKQMREMHETSKVLCALNQFPVTQLRIFFPDNHVIQAAFKPTETIAQVEKFVREFLSNPNTEFSLCMRHPQRTLEPDVTLVAADCVPNARLYFTSSSSSPYLNKETLEKKSSFSSSCSAMKSRRMRKPAHYLGASDASNETFDNSEPGSSTQRSSVADTCGSEAGYQKRTNTSMQATGAIKKVPKWFKTGK